MDNMAGDLFMAMMLCLIHGLSTIAVIHLFSTAITLTTDISTRLCCRLPSNHSLPVQQMQLKYGAY